MAIKIEIDGNDISDYVISCDKIPLAGSRNRNKTPIIGEFKMEISQKCTDTLQGDIDVYLDSGSSYPYFVGVIIHNKTNYENKSYELLIRSKLCLLEENSLNYPNLNSLIVAGSSPDYVMDLIGTEGSETNYNAPSARVTWIIDRMFYDAGVDFAFDTGFTSHIVIGSTTVNDLRMDINMLWCLNQDTANKMDTSYYYDSYPYKNKIINYWNYISAFCSHIGAKIELSTTGTAKVFIMKIIDDTGTLSIDDDLIYSKDVDVLEPESSGTLLNFYHAAKRDYYQHTPVSLASPFEELSWGEGRDLITLMKSFMYIFEYGDYIHDLSYYTNWPYHADDYVVYLKEKMEGTWNAVKITTDLTFQTHARINYLIVGKQEIELIFDYT